MEDPSGSTLWTLIKSSLAGAEGKQSEIPEADEGQLLNNLDNYFQARVQEVMVPRTQMASIEQSKTIVQAMELHHESGHSRIPVYDGSPDKIVGILYSIDLFPFVTEKRETPISQVMRKPLLVSYSQPIYQLLERFKQEHTHMAIVIDEYGGVDGVVTMVDILEELVGDIPDEHDKDLGPAYEEVEDGMIIMDAGYPLDEFNQLFKTKYLKEGIETIAGYVCHVLGKIPQKNETFKIDDLSFTVEESSDRSLEKLRLPTPINIK